MARRCTATGCARRSRPSTDDEALLDLLVVATDVYTWKLLRIDRGHSRAVTERRLHDLVDAVLAAGSKEH